jgi:hypothetical protein
MRGGRLLLVSVLGLGVAACGLTVSTINARPDKYYQHKVVFVGEIVRRQDLPGETLLEVSDVRGGRILVRSADPVEAESGGWVKVRGLLVPEAKVGGTLLYDVVLAERVAPTRAPRLRNLM